MYTILFYVYYTSILFLRLIAASKYNFFAMIPGTNGITVLSGGGSPQVIKTVNTSAVASSNPASAPKVQKLIKIGNRFIPRTSIVSVKKALTKDNTIVYVAVSNSDVKS